MKINILLIRTLIITVFISLFIGFIPAKGQLNVGFMNPQTVMDTLPARKQVSQQLNQFIKQKRSQLKQQTVTFQKRIAQLQKQAQNANPTRQQQLQDSLDVLNQRLRQYRMQIQKQLQRRRSKLLQPVYARIDSAIQVVAERRNLDFVLNEITSRGESIIFYASSDKLNITNEVINELLSQ